LPIRSFGPQHLANDFVAAVAVYDVIRDIQSMGSHLRQGEGAAPVSDGGISLTERLFGRRRGHTSAIAPVSQSIPRNNQQSSSVTSSDVLEGAIRHEGLQGVQFTDNFVVFGPENDSVEEIVRFDI